ncbi:LAFA_0F09582g1_1 [Lachancea sp. 'fantastica']|nr:LAFA_0F09582g1_1 [Lachancea sp. 'fantastica']
MALKNLPIQPSNVSIAPNPKPNATRDTRKPGGHGLVIRTSRQWVLPPRPKPGRKPCLSALQRGSKSSPPTQQNCGNGNPATDNTCVARPPRANSISGSGKCDKKVGTEQSLESQTEPKIGPKTLVKPEVKTEPMPLLSSSSSSPISSIPAPAPATRSISPLSTQPIVAPVPPVTAITSSASNEPASVSENTSRPASAVPRTNVPLPSLEPSNAPLRSIALVSKQQVQGPTLPRQSLSPTSPGTTSASATTTIRPQQSLPATGAQTVKKLTKTALKKEIQHLKLENFKLKQEMGHLVGHLQDLKHKFSARNEASSAIAPASLHSNCNKKRAFLDSMEQKEFFDNTESFLKFEDDDAEADDASHTIISAAHMKPTMSFSSQYSSKTNLTDDEDPGFSSSTPSSLFSAELQRTVTNSSLASSQPYHHHLQSLQNTSSTSSYSPLLHGSSSPSSLVANKIQPHPLDGMRFVDDYEHQDFYSKHRQLFENRVAPSLPSTSSVSPSASNQLGDFHLDAIKEEDMDFRLEHDFGNENVSILNFLENHSSRFDNDTAATTAVTNTVPRWLMKEEQEVEKSDMSVFQNFSPEPELLKAEFRMPPSLEELMGEADAPEIKREDDEEDDLSRMNIFDFA